MTKKMESSDEGGLQDLTIFTHESLDFRELIKHLSLHPGFPCSQHIRNHFLAQYGTYVKHPDLIDKTVDENPWQTYFDYRKDAMVVAIGDVPQSIRRGEKQSAHSAAKDEGVWALVAVYPSYSPGWVSLSENEQSQMDSIWNAIRTTFWLSTEMPFEQYLTPDKVRQASDSERNLLKFIFHQHLPKAISQLASALPTFSNIKRFGQDERLILSDLHAVNHIWMKELQAIQTSDVNVDSSWKVVRCNPCVTFTLPENIALHLSDNVDSSRWSKRFVGDRKGELELVVNSNNIRYPTYYPKARRHLSVILYDEQGVKTDHQDIEQHYPTDISNGAPAGWAYAHEDFSLGSLHVATPYRRFKSTNKSNKKKQGVGSICLALMAERLIQVQKDALQLIGCLDYREYPTPILSDAEQHKEVAVAFHLGAGFVPQSITSWGAFAILPHNKDM